MKSYQHTQPARAIIAGLTGTGLVFAVLSIFVHTFIFGTGVLFISAYLFRSMTIEISDTELTWYFGSGFPRKRVPIGEVVSVEPVRTTLWEGWGIHYTSRGWLYNASGYGAVAIKLRNGKRFCLGTDEPEILAKQLTRPS